MSDERKTSIYTAIHFVFAVVAIIMIVAIAFSPSTSNKDNFDMIGKIIAALVGGRVLLEIGYIALFRRKKWQGILQNRK